MPSTHRLHASSRSHLQPRSGMQAPARTWPWLLGGSCVLAGVPSAESTQEGVAGKQLRALDASAARLL
eukprot:4395954-Pyramimonas_sp.AAC.1